MDVGNRLFGELQVEKFHLEFPDSPLGETLSRKFGLSEEKPPDKVDRDSSGPRKSQSDSRTKLDRSDLKRVYPASPPSSLWSLTTLLEDLARAHSCRSKDTNDSSCTTP